MKKAISLFLTLLLCLSLLSGCAYVELPEIDIPGTSAQTEATFTNISQDNLPTYEGSPFVVLNQNRPDLPTDINLTTSYEYYAELDYLGRVTYAEANVGRDIMPTEDRGNISSVRPTGWQSVQYGIVEGGSLYNRCHLIAFQLTGENANVCNLMTGTRYLNTQGMLPFEELIGDYVRETGNHVLYRVTPVFKDTELVARGVIMEARSVEDGGEGVCFSVYAFNVQPGIEIDYATGENKLDRDYVAPENADADFILNTNSKKFHRPNCPSVADISPKNRQNFKGTAQDLEKMGYAPCGGCKPE